MYKLKSLLMITVFSFGITLFFIGCDSTNSQTNDNSNSVNQENVNNISNSTTFTSSDKNITFALPGNFTSKEDTFLNEMKIQSIDSRTVMVVQKGAYAMIAGDNKKFAQKVDTVATAELESTYNVKLEQYTVQGTGFMEFPEAGDNFPDWMTEGARVTVISNDDISLGDDTNTGENPLLKPVYYIVLPKDGDQVLLEAVLKTIKILPVS